MLANHKLMGKRDLKRKLKERNQLPQASSNSSNNQRKKARRTRREEIKMTHKAIPLVRTTMN